MKISFVDLSKQYAPIKAKIKASIARVLKETNFIKGKEMYLFEKEFAKYIGAKSCISVASGTDALILGVKALNIPIGSEIILPSNTFYSTALCISQNGLKPVFVDVDENDNGISIDDLKKKITNKTKAVIVVHLYGLADKIDEITKVIKQSGNKIILIEDACQAHGANYKGKKVGNFGVFSAFSFYPGKNLGAYGDGGAIVTSNKKIAEKCRMLRDLGQEKKYSHSILGANSRLDTLQAAILSVKLPHLDVWNRKRYENAKIYNELLSPIGKFVKTPVFFKDRNSIFHLYVIKALKRDRLIKYLNNQGISCLIHYPTPLHLQKVFGNLGYKRGDLPIAEKLSNEIISLPMYPELSKRQMIFIANKIKEFYEKY